jgi:S-DNA-T family DNA segregation ATPase FtsK/SpoIIIE
MKSVVEAVAHLAEQEIRSQFTSDDRSPMVRVTCAKSRPEIVTLVHRLRNWDTPRGLDALRVVVTAREVWEGLKESETVPRGDETPTTLRNLQRVGVVLIEGDDYTDRQSWQSVRSISDGRLLNERSARERLVSFALGRGINDLPRIVVDALEEVHVAVSGRAGDTVSVRTWIAFVLGACAHLDGLDVLDAKTTWCSIGASLPLAGLFCDDRLSELSQVDRKRQLKKNFEDSSKLFAEADDSWRDLLEERLPSIEFVNPSGVVEAEQKRIRSDLEAVLSGRDKDAKSRVLYRHWSQLVSSKSQKVGLGSRIRELIEMSSPERIAEYDELDVADGIDDGDSDAAQKLLDLPPPRDGIQPLARMLDPKVVVALERIAAPRAPAAFAPFAELLRAATEMVGERVELAEGDSAGAVLVVEPAKKADENRHSTALFAWLFGPTLNLVKEAVEGEQVSLQVDAALLDTTPLHGFEKTADGDDDDQGEFETLSIRLRWADGGFRERRVDWKPHATPGLVALWRLIDNERAYSWCPGEEITFESWLSSAMSRGPMAGARALQADASPIANRWATERSARFAQLARSGLRSNVLASVADTYLETLRDLRGNYVPSGAARVEVAQILDCDVASWRAGPVVLATHPIRLRWIARYLERVGELFTLALRGELRTNPVNPDLFFSELLGLSPQSQPPVLVLGDQLCVAVREQDWHEVFRPLKDERGERRDWLADLDDSAIDDASRTIGRFLDAYPHKADGLHLLYIVRRNGARGLGRLIRSVIARREPVTASLRLTLFVDPAELRPTEEVLQQFDDADHRAVSDRPPIEVIVHRWADPARGLPDLRGLGPHVDVAVVPNLFGAATRTHDGTRDGRLSGGRFDPLLDEPTRLEAVNSSGAPSAAVSRVLLPQGADEILEAWSTVNTRQFRGSPIADSPSDSDIDHVTIQVSLDRNREFFDALHTAAQWVVTIDTFVGREQIEALENGPDVIQVKTGVGANGAYRLVVSSSFGRAFVERRISRRLSQQLPSMMVHDPNALAAEIYERARLLVPGIVLRSVGLGLTAAEMVGIVLARARVEAVERANVAPHGFQSWLSLDEHLDWFGGQQSTRADLVRIRGWLESRTLVLQLDVIEAKMRTQVDVSRAEGQLRRSVELLQAALAAPDDDGPDYVDRDMWRRLVWRAIEQTSASVDAVPAATHIMAPDGHRSTLDEALRAALQEGNVKVLPVTGILVSASVAEVSHDRTTPSGYRWLQLSRDEVRSELRRLSDPKPYPLGDRPLKSESADVHSALEPANIAPADSPSRQLFAKPERVAEATTVEQPPLRNGNRGGRSAAAVARMQQLLDALAARGIDVRPEGSPDDALEGPGFFMLRVCLGASHRPQQVSALTEDLQYHLGLGSGQLPRIYVDRGAVVVEIPKRESERYYVGAQDLWARTDWPTDRLYAPIGCNVRDEPVGIDFSSSRSPHLLVGGMTGGGKSVALEALLLGLVRHYPAERLELRVIDPKGNEFASFEGLPHLPDPPGMDAEDAIQMLTTTCDEMDARYRSLKELTRTTKVRIPDIAAFNSRVSEAERFKWVLVVLDEFADLTADKENKKVIEGLLQRLAQKARAAGIHVIVATQKPSAEVISTTTRSNLGAQLALRVRSATDSRVIMESTGAESLAGNGDAFLRLSGEEAVRVQCAKA